MRIYFKITICLLFFISCNKKPIYYAHRAYWHIENKSNTPLYYWGYQDGAIEMEQSLGVGAKVELFMYEASEQQIFSFSDIADIIDSIRIYNGNKYITFKADKLLEDVFFNEGNWQFDKTIHDSYWDGELYSRTWTFKIDDTFF